MTEGSSQGQQPSDQRTPQETKEQTPEVVQSGQAEEAGLWAWLEAIWGWICSWFQTSENKTAPTSAQQPASAPSQEKSGEQKEEKKGLQEVEVDLTGYNASEADTLKENAKKVMLLDRDFHKAVIEVEKATGQEVLATEKMEKF